MSQSVKPGAMPTMTANRTVMPPSVRQMRTSHGRLAPRVPLALDWQLDSRPLATSIG